MKMTMREKDYPIIGELARRLENIEDQLLFSRSARDLIKLVSLHPESTALLTPSRPLLAHAGLGEDALAIALDAERRSLMKTDETRLVGYKSACLAWEAAWPQLTQEISNLPLQLAHQRMCAAALDHLPIAV